MTAGSPTDGPDDAASRDDAPGPDDPPGPDDVAEQGDRLQVLRMFVVVAGFSTALGAIAVVFPLAGLAAGFAPATVALLASSAGASQLLTRFGLPWLLTVVPDRLLIAGAGTAMCAGVGLMMGNQRVVGFLLAQLLFGVSRALFWTASQNHAVRTPGSQVRRLAQVNMANTGGVMAGPVLAGLLADRDLGLALWVVMVAGLVTILTAFLLPSRPGLPRTARQGRTPVWRRREPLLGYGVGFMAGSWAGLVDSYVPIVLVAAGYAASQIGLLITLAAVMQLVASGWLTRSREYDLVTLAAVSAACVLVSASAIPAAGVNIAIPIAIMALAGIGAGLSAPTSAALTTRMVTTGEQGTALSVLGGYRSVGRMTTPSLAAGTTSLFGLATALPVVAAVVAGPTFVLALARRARSDDALPVA